MPDDSAERATILQRAQSLYDATVRQHEKMLARDAESPMLHDDLMVQQARLGLTLSAMLERLTHRQDQHAEGLMQQHALLADWLDRHAMLMDHLAQTCDAMLDLLRRRNTH